MAGPVGSDHSMLVLTAGELVDEQFRVVPDSALDALGVIRGIPSLNSCVGKCA
jgi:hypothetical protein